MSKVIEQLNSRFTIVCETVFNGEKISNSIFVKDTYVDKLIVKLSPLYPTEIINNSIVGTNSDEHFFYIDTRTAEVVVINQTNAGFEFLNSDLIHINGPDGEILFNTTESKVKATTSSGMFLFEHGLIKCVENNSTRIYDKTGELMSTIPNI